MAVDTQRRRAVMARSLKLGHCICNPKKMCPCDTFKERNVCSCAGERFPVREKEVALTSYVRKAGCASKIGQADLLRILKKLPPVTDPRVLVGIAAGDDAGVYRIDDRYSLVQTVDVFTPCVDEAYLFGQIAASNSVSDVYAMGGRPITALSIIGFPIEELDDSVMEAILRGGIDKLREADCPVIGGHSINDEEIKFGFAVTGVIDADKIVERGRCRAGDLLVLTKPLGTGMVCFARQIGRVSEEGLREVGASMATLNKDAAELMLKYKAHACTDITGYGLSGHLVEMLGEGGIQAEIDMSELPVFAAAAECLENDILPGAIERNQDYSQAWIAARDGEGEKNLAILYDPQTSGGLLVSLPERRAMVFVEEMQGRGHGSTSIIGRIVKKKGSVSRVKVLITNSRLQKLIGKKGVVTMPEKGKKRVPDKDEEPVPGQGPSTCRSASSGPEDAS